MLFEEKEMTTLEWKLKYRLANKERKFIQYKEITNNKLKEYKQSLEEIRESFKGFRISTIPFHIADNGKMPHRMADEIQHYSEKIIDKIDEILNK